MTTLGIDIGCISLKAALVGEADDQDLFSDLLRQHPDLFQTPRDGLTVIDGAPVLVAQYRRIKGSPADAAQALLGELLAVLPEGSLHGVRVTGSGGRLVGPALDAPFENEFKAIARGIGALHPETHTVFEMGGETSKFIRLETGDGRLRRHRRLPDQRRLRRRHRLLHGPAGQPPALRHRGRRRHRARRRARRPASPAAAACSPRAT